MYVRQDRAARRLAVLAALVAGTLALPAVLAAAAGPQATVSVTVTGSGRVQSSPGGVDCGSTCTAAFPLGSAVRLIATPSPGSYFAGWGGSCVGSSPTCDTNADEGTQVQAQFAAGSPPTPAVHALTVSYSGEGRVTSSDPGVIDCGDNCWTSFSGGGHVVLTATPASGFVFDGWAGDCSGTGSCDVAVTGLKSVVAVFKHTNTPTDGTTDLTVSSSEPGTGHNQGRIRVSWQGGSKVVCDDECTINGVPRGKRVTIQPLPGPDTVVNDFGVYCHGSAQQCVVILADGEGVTTSFQDAETLTTSYGLNLTRSPGGSVKSVPPGIDCGGDTGCRAAFKRNITVKLTANVTSGYAFGGWSGDCSGSGTCSVSMAVSRTVSAVFRAQRDQLQVTKSGRGLGKVTTEPGGINCGRVCTYGFKRGTAVTLRAKPTKTSRFAGWSGACSGRAPCSLTIGGAADVNAAFDRCAALVFSGFGVSPTRGAVTLRVSLADRATARVRVKRGSSTLVTKTFANLSAGKKSLRVSVPGRARGSSAKVELRLNDICGRKRTRTRSVVLR